MLHTICDDLQIIFFLNSTKNGGKYSQTDREKGGGGYVLLLGDESVVTPECLGPRLLRHISIVEESGTEWKADRRSYGVAQ